MEAKVAQSKTFNSKYDNTDYAPAVGPRDLVAGAYNSLDLMFQQNQYYETLLKQHELLSKGNIRIQDRADDGSVVVRDVPAIELVTPMTEFDKIRLDTIMRINRATEAQRKEWMLRFETESTAVLAEKIANYTHDRRMKQKVFEDFTT